MEKLIKINYLVIAFLVTIITMNSTAMENFFITETTIATAPHRIVKHALHSYTIDSENFKIPKAVVKTADIFYDNNKPNLIFGQLSKIADPAQSEAAERLLFKTIVKKLTKDGADELIALNPRTLAPIIIPLKKKRKKNRSAALYQR